MNDEEINDEEIRVLMAILGEVKEIREGLEKIENGLAWLGALLIILVVSLLWRGCH